MIFSNVSTRLGIHARRLSVILTLILMLAMGTLLMGLMSLSGCGTNAPTKAAQAEQVVITTVNDAVHVIVPMINAGKLTQAQCNAFTEAYSKYYAAQMVVKAAIEKVNAGQPGATAADIASAQTAVDNAETSLLALVNSYLK